MLRLFSVRGATQVERDGSEEMKVAVTELMEELIKKNRIDSEQIVHIIFSQTPDLVAENPARALRSVGFDRVPLFCTQEPSYPDTLPRMVRVLLSYYQGDEHSPSPVYLGGAEKLRSDLFG